ncbi:uncharacterized protein M6B38_368120 [Iris pallida]|uniref:Uncharacterized protein n=1 Tax=Iris pallida TaxID=29817 RepID=A0AAX6GFX9_IRIPA|nr:uncharacterized protein M6B38_368120 [Iris pallida]
MTQKQLLEINQSMHELRRASILLFIFLGLSTTAKGQMPMQLLSREELARIAGYGEEKLSSVLIMGSVLCQACQQPGSELPVSQVSGVKVAVACRTEGRKRRANCAYGTTDELGEFMVDLPSKLHWLPALEEACVVRVLRLPRSSPCRDAVRVRPRPIKLTSVGNSIRVYTAGTVRIGRRSKASDHGCTRKRNDRGGVLESSW